MKPETKRAWGYCLLVFLALRIGVSLLTLLGPGVLPSRGAVDAPGRPDRPITPGLHNAFVGLEHQDALWFLRIAEDGYEDADGSAAFFPGYPLAVRGVSFLFGGHELAAATLVSNAALLLALVLLYDLTRRERSEEAARRTILYLCVFPTAFFLVAPYSESLFLLLAVVAFRAARLRRVPSAALAGMGAAFTRSIGVILAPALAAEVIQTWREDRREGHRGPGWALAVRLACVALIPLGTLAFIGYWASRGDAGAPMHYQSANWLRSFHWPFESLWLAVRGALDLGGYLLLDLLIVAPCFVLAAIGVGKLRSGYSVYVWLGLLVPLCLVWPDRPLMSMPRFMVVLFPIFWVLADLTLRRKLPHALVLAVSGAGLGLLTVMFSTNHFIF